MSQFGQLEEVSADLKQYVSTNIDLLKLQATERASVIGSELFSSLIIGLVAFVFVVIASLGGALFLSALLDSAYLGFVIVSGFYLLIGIILLLGKKRMLRNPLRNSIIRKILNP